MGLELAKAFITVGADASQLGPDLRRAQNAAVGQLGQMSGMLSGLFMSAAGAFGLSSMFGFAKDAIGEAETAIQSTRRLQAVLDATGHTAGFAAKQLTDYASELQNATTIGDDEIVDSMSKLATFRSVAGETFKRATELALDLAGTGFVSVGQGATMLGKALEDPIRGVGALRRVGVSFNADQQKQIKAFTKAGETAKAQGLILDVVALQVGGVARALGQTPVGKMAQLKNAIGDVKEEIGAKLIPGMISWQTLQLKVMHGVNAGIGVLNTFAGGVSALNDATGGYLITLVEVTLATGGLVVLLPKLAAGATLVGRAIGLATISSGWGVLIVGVGLAVAAVIELSQWLYTLAPVQEALASAGVKFGVVWDRMGTIVDNVTVTIGGLVHTAAVGLGNLLGLDFTTFPETLGAMAAAGIDYIAEFALAASGFMQAVTENWQLGWTLIKTSGAYAFSVLQDVAGNVFDNLVGYAVATGDGISRAFFVSLEQVGPIFAAYTTLAEAGWNLVVQAAKTYGNAVVSVWTSGLLLISNAWGPFVNVTTEVWSLFGTLARVALTKWWDIFSGTFTGILGIYQIVFSEMVTIAAASFMAIKGGMGALTTDLIRIPQLLQAISSGNFALAGVLAGSFDVGTHLSDSMEKAFTEAGGSASIGRIGEAVGDVVSTHLGQMLELPGELAAEIGNSGLGAAYVELGATLGNSLSEGADRLSTVLSDPALMDAVVGYGDAWLGTVDAVADGVGNVANAFLGAFTDVDVPGLLDLSGASTLLGEGVVGAFNEIVKLMPEMPALTVPEEEKPLPKKGEDKTKAGEDIKDKRIGFVELGKKIQDAVLGAANPQETTADESVKHTGLLTDIGKGIQDLVLKAEGKSPTVAPPSVNMGAATMGPPAIVPYIPPAGTSVGKSGTAPPNLAGAAMGGAGLGATSQSLAAPVVGAAIGAALGANRPTPPAAAVAVRPGDPAKRLLEEAIRHTALLTSINEGLAKPRIAVLA